MGLRVRAPVARALASASSVPQAVEFLELGFHALGVEGVGLDEQLAEAMQINELTTESFMHMLAVVAERCSP